MEMKKHEVKCMEVPEFEETKEKLLEDGMTEDEIEEKLESLEEQYEGMITKKEVLAHIMAKERGLVQTSPRRTGGTGRPKGDPDEVTIDELVDGMNNVVVQAYVVDERITNTKDGDKMKWLTIIDSTGSVSATVFGDGVEWEYEYGEVVKIEGKTFSTNEGDICLSSYSSPEVLSEDESDLEESVDDLLEKDIEELEEDMDMVLVKGYAVERRLTETKSGDEMSWVTIVDETGSTSATLFGEASHNWDYEFGQPIAVRGQTFSTGGEICPSTWKEPEVLDESDMDKTLEEIIEREIGELDEIHERKYVVVEGLCTDYYENSYSGCKNCKSKKENCDCEGDYGMSEYTFKNMTVMTKDGKDSVKASADPSTDVPDDLELNCVRVYGEYTDGSDDDNEKVIEISKVQKLTGEENPMRESNETTDTSKSDSKKTEDEKESKDVELPEIAKDTVSVGFMGEEAVADILGFVERFGEVPEEMFLKYVEGNTDVEPADGALEQMLDDGILYKNEDEKIEMTKED